MSFTSRRKEMLRWISSSRLAMAISSVDCLLRVHSQERRELIYMRPRHQSPPLDCGLPDRDAAPPYSPPRNREQGAQDPVIFRERPLRTRLKPASRSGEHHVRDEHAEIEPAS